MDEKTRRLFIEIHQEYESQSPSIRDETPYLSELLELQNQLLSGHRPPEQIREDFENLKAHNSSPQS